MISYVEDFKNHKEFLVMHVVVEFSSLKYMRMEYN